MVDYKADGLASGQGALRSATMIILARVTSMNDPSMDEDRAQPPSVGLPNLSVELRQDDNLAQLTAMVQAMIKSRQLVSGDRLGSERHLSDALGVTRTKLRQALQPLEAAGRIRRLQGRGGGVFVSDGKVERSAGEVNGVPRLLRLQGYAPSTKVLRAFIEPAGAEESRRLNLEPGVPVFTIIRLRLADGVPLSLERSTLPAHDFPGLMQKPLNLSLYEILREVYDSAPTWADEAIDAVPADEDQARQLNVPTGATLLRIKRVAFNQKNHPIEFALDRFRADRTKIRVRSQKR